jgi:hypothetical protein
MIEGSLTYRERVALPPDALWRWSRRGMRAGRLLGEATLGDAGRAGAVAIPIGGARGARRRAAGGACRGWARPMVCGRHRDSGWNRPCFAWATSCCRRFVPMGFAKLTALRRPRACGGILRGQRGARGRRAADGARARPAASGARFEAPDDPGTWVWSQGNAVRVSLAGEALPECSVVPPETPRPYRAQGNEPGWVLTVADGRTDARCGIRRADGRGGAARGAVRGGAFVYAVAEFGADAADGAGSLPGRHDRVCPIPRRSLSRSRGGSFMGCGGDPLRPPDGAEWVVEDIGDAGSSTRLGSP